MGLSAILAAWFSRLARGTASFPGAPPIPDAPVKPRYAKGIDVSLHQGEIDWDAVAASGVDFAIVKATQYGFKDHTTGVIKPGRGVDPQFKRNQAEARRTMKRVGFYHWMEPQFKDSPNGDGASQADYFAKIVGALRPGEFLALDLENRGLTAAVVVPQMRAFLEQLELLTDRKPYVYTNATFPYKLGAQLSAYPLWIVSVTSLDAPRLPAGWTEWVIWQFTGKGKCPGIVGNVDLDAARHEWVKEHLT